MKKVNEKEKSIHMKVDPHEAKAGAFSDLYYPMSKDQVRKKLALKSFWLLFPIGGLLIGIFVEVLKVLLGK